MNSKPVLLPIFLLSSIALCGAQASMPRIAMRDPGDGANWKERFINEAPAGWARYKSRAGRFQGTNVHKEFLLAPEKKLLGEVRTELKQAPGCGLILTQDTDAKGSLACVNPNYRFKLVRAKDSSPWAISDVSHDLIKNAPQIQQYRDTIGIVKAAVLAPIGLNFYPKDDWPAMLSSDDFRLKAIVPVQQGPCTLAQVDFEMNWAPSKETIARVKSGRVWFDPDHWWVMRKCEYKLEQYRGETKPFTYVKRLVTYDYEYADSPIPLLKSIVTRHIKKTGDIEVHDEFALVVKEVPERDFTLSAFGLPEPGPQTGSQSRWYLWIALGGVICLVLAFLVRRWSVSR